MVIIIPALVMFVFLAAIPVLLVGGYGPDECDPDW